MVDTIKFNVGGRHFEVSRLLVEQNPGTMLARMISDTWDKNSDKPLFIDRDGDSFAHVLNYLRYGSIELPESIPETTFKRELDYFGVRVNEGSVLQWKKKTFVEIRDSVNRQIAEAEKHKHILALAVACFNCYNVKSMDGRAVSLYLKDYECGKYLMKNGMDCDDKAAKTLREYLVQYFGLDVKFTSAFVLKVSRMKS